MRLYKQFVNLLKLAYIKMTLKCCSGASTTSSILSKFHILF